MALRQHLQNIRDAVELLESAWFDRTRRVVTAGHTSLRAAGVPQSEIADSEAYVPARPTNVRAALRQTGIDDFSTFTYVDLGSGKGRSLFIAAEFPFREIVGVEFVYELHAIACRNIAQFSSRRKRSGPIRAVLGNVKEFSLPAGNLLLYLFNPFGPDTMARVLDKLKKAHAREPSRDIYIVLVWPRCGDQVAATLPSAQLLKSTRRHQIFCLPMATDQKSQKRTS